MSDVKPIPCKKVYEKNVRQWFAKLNEELDEAKEAVLKAYNLDQFIDGGETLNDDDRLLIGLECADVITAITSFQEAMGIKEKDRDMFQALVNQSNFERGRL